MRRRGPCDAACGCGRDAAGDDGGSSETAVDAGVLGAAKQVVLRGEHKLGWPAAATGDQPKLAGTRNAQSENGQCEHSSVAGCSETGRRRNTSRRGPEMASAGVVAETERSHPGRRKPVPEETGRRSRSRAQPDYRGHG